MGYDKRACWLADAGGRGSTKSDNRGNNNQPQQQQQSSHRREVKTCPKISAPMVPNIADAAAAATGATAAVLHVQYDDINSSIMRLFTILSLSSSLCVDAPLTTT